MHLLFHPLCCHIQKKHACKYVQMQTRDWKKSDHVFQEAVLNLHIVKRVVFYHGNILVLQSSSSLLFSSSSFFFPLFHFQGTEKIKNKKSCIQAKLSFKKYKPSFPSTEDLFCSIHVKSVRDRFLSHAN